MNRTSTNAPVEPFLEVSNVVKSFGSTQVLHGVSFAIGRGEVVCLLGPSGCGKTTLLRIVAGLEQADAGAVIFDGADLAHAPVHRRGFGLMFQDFVLFPHKNVYDNVAFGLRMAGLDKAVVRRRVAEMLELVGLAGYEERRVFELSGGQQQRVALARSLAPSPALLMLDEPLGSLDRTLREDLLDELRRILKTPLSPLARPVLNPPAKGLPSEGRGVTALYVTHDQQEAFAIADRVIIMNAGRIEQEGAPMEVYRRPANRFVARFLGMHNLLPGRVLGEEGDGLAVATSLGVMVCGNDSTGIAGQAVTVVVRPDAASLLPDSTPSRAANVLYGVLLDRSFRGSQVKVELVCGSSTRLVFELPGGAANNLPDSGQPIQLLLDSSGLSLLQGQVE